MDLSHFVAQVVAIIYLSIGIGMLFNVDYYKKMFTKMYEEMTAMYVGGFAAIVTGFALVTHHNIWAKNWTILVTIIGWLALIKGISLIAFPKQFQSLSLPMIQRGTGILGIIVLALGLIFGYFGFFA